MRVLILGGSGMLGHKLVQQFNRYYDTWSTVKYRSDSLHTISNVNVVDFQSVVRAVALVKPDVIVNCVGLIKQLTADPVDFIYINALYPQLLANLCAAAKVRLIHISSDCVFSGEHGMYLEGDTSDAEDIYGRTKYLGEVYEPALTIRTSIIGPELNTKSGLFEWFRSQTSVTGYKQAFFSGFTTLELSKILTNIISCHRDLTGLYHVSALPINKFDLLEIINDVYQLGIVIRPDYDFMCDRSLDSTRFREATDFAPKCWRTMIEEMHNDER